MHQDNNRHQNSGVAGTAANNRPKGPLNGLPCPDTFQDRYPDRDISPGHIYQRTTVSGVGTVERGRPNSKGNGHYWLVSDFIPKKSKKSEFSNFDQKF